MRLTGSAESWWRHGLEFLQFRSHRGRCRSDLITVCVVWGGLWVIKSLHVWVCVDLQQLVKIHLRVETATIPIHMSHMSYVIYKTFNPVGSCSSDRSSTWLCPSTCPRLSWWILTLCLHAAGVPGVHGTRGSLDGLSRATPAHPAQTRTQKSKSKPHRSGEAGKRQVRSANQAN